MMPQCPSHICSNRRRFNRELCMLERLKLACCLQVDSDEMGHCKVEDWMMFSMLKSPPPPGQQTEMPVLLVHMGLR
jgi:hypothetical protein